MPKYIESESLELKEKYTESICKEIVSFLNASGGTIVIGVIVNDKIKFTQSYKGTLIAHLA